MHSRSDGDRRSVVSLLLGLGFGAISGAIGGIAGISLGLGHGIVQLSWENSTDGLLHGAGIGVIFSVAVCLVGAIAGIGGTSKRNMAVTVASCIAFGLLGSGSLMYWMAALASSA